MTNEEIYKGLSSDNGLRAHSFMGVIPKESNIQFIQDTIFPALKNHPDFRLHNLIVKEINLGESPAILNMEWVAKVEYKGIITEAYFSIGKTSSIGLEKMTSSHMDNLYLIKAFNNPYFLYCRQLFSSEPLDSFLLQLKLMYAIVPQPYLVMDFSSNRLFSSKWLDMACSTNTPPSPRNLYLIQVLNNVDKKGKTRYWLRTNGLYRCGSPELEMVNIYSGSKEMSRLLHVTSSLMVQSSYQENSVIKVGYDGLEINLCWIRWEKALKKYSEDAFGGFNYRQDLKYGYNKYKDPSGVVFAVEEGIFTSPEIYISAVKNTPQYTIHPKENMRLRALARERYDYFSRAYQEYNRPIFEKPRMALQSNEDTKKWKFLVKIQLQNRNSDPQEMKDQLWFEVKSMDEDEIQATLLNKPFWTKSIKQGDTITSSIAENLVDWTIINPDQTEFSPDNIYLLYP